MSRLYYIYPFGQNADDLTAIPMPVAGDGSVSYYAGWTDPYEYDLLTNPAALPIPRGQTNQLFYDITNNIQQYQQYGVPFWITSSDNGGTSFPYPKYALAMYGGIVYENQVASNTATPGTDSTWLQLSGNAQGVPVGTVIDYAGAVAPTGYLTCDGSQISRSTYANLLAALLITQTGTITNLSPVVTGLSDTSNMYPGMAVEGTNIPSGTAVLTVDSSTQVTLTHNATGSATESVFFYLWGNGDNSTTFNLPDLRRKTTIGKFGTGSTVVGNKVGQTGGEEAHTQTTNEMPSHNHPGSYWNLTEDHLSGGSSGGVPVYYSANPASNTPVTVASQGGGAAFNIMQPSAVVNKCIKY